MITRYILPCHEPTQRFTMIQRRENGISKTLRHRALPSMTMAFRLLIGFRAPRTSLRTNPSTKSANSRTDFSTAIRAKSSRNCRWEMSSLLAVLPQASNFSSNLSPVFPLPNVCEPRATTTRAHINTESVETTHTRTLTDARTCTLSGRLLVIPGMQNDCVHQTQPT